MKLLIDSGNPRSFEDLISGHEGPPVRLAAELLLPAHRGEPPAAVIVAPGSGGLSPSHRLHAEALVAAGIAACVVDPFSGRGVTETITDQKRVSFAASTYDVLAAARLLRAHGAVDPERIGAIGYSRGGIAVLLAASAQLAEAVLGPGKALKAVFGAWPWCGYQFQNARTAPTAIRFAVAELDDWVSPVQSQAWAAAMKPGNPRVSLRIFRQAHHGFGYREGLKELPQAIKAFNAPIVYLDDRGTFLDWYSGAPLPGVDDRHWEQAAAAWLGRGVTVGSQPGQYEDFIADMMRFFTAEMTL
jgi:dienelactone hydrolase